MKTSVIDPEIAKNLKIKKNEKCRTNRWVSNVYILEWPFLHCRKFHYFLSLIKIETYSGGKIGGKINLFI